MSPDAIVMRLPLEQIQLIQRSRIKLALEPALAMPVDIIAIKCGVPPTVFQRIALAADVSLGGA